MTVHVVNPKDPAHPLLEELANRTGIPLGTLRAMTTVNPCPGSCDRRKRVRWAEWVQGRAIVHTCPGGDR